MFNFRIQPLTTLIISYYKRFVLKEGENEIAVKDNNSDEALSAIEHTVDI